MTGYGRAREPRAGCWCRAWLGPGRAQHAAHRRRPRRGRRYRLDLTVLVVLLPLLAALCATVAQRCRHLTPTVAGLGAGQLALHQLMELLHPTHAAAGPAPAPGAQMIAMHAVATVVTAVALRHADRAIAGLVEALRRVLPRRLNPPPADRPLPMLAMPGPAVPARLARAFAVAHSRRGPPVEC